MQIIERDFDIDEVLHKSLFAHLSTLGERGPCETPVWFIWEDKCLWFIASSRSGFVKRIREDSRCAVGIVDFDLMNGVLKHIGMRGTSALLPMERPRLTRLLQRYLGPEASWNPWFRSNVIEKQDVLIQFEPKTVVARDQSYFR